MARGALAPSAPLTRVLAALGVAALAAGCGHTVGLDAGAPPGVDGASADGGAAADASTTDAAQTDAGATSADASPSDAVTSGADAGASRPDAGPSTCPARPACDAPLPDVGPATQWRHTASRLSSIGSPRHRGRDLFLRAGQPAWVIGKFAYGVLDDDIKDEDVDVWLLRGCGSTWTRVGTFRTTEDRAHPTVLGVEDTGGRLYVDLTAEGQAPLEVGRHRVLLSVQADRSAAELFLEVLPASAQVVVTDIDGTLTSSEWAAVTDIIGLAPPEAHPGAADVMTTLVARGYSMLYLTARPEWMTPVTREWLALRGFPPGVLHTTLSALGAVGGPAAAYKTTELASLSTELGLVPAWAFGNKDTDAEAYDNAGVTPAHAYYYGLPAADARGGQVHEDYRGLVPIVAQTPSICP